jgi:ABC-type transport system involved in multi-copper enzyme maturation permease subunit
VRRLLTMTGRAPATRPLPGFANLLRKDVREWLATPRALATAVGSITLTTIATISPWLGRQRGLRDATRVVDATTAFGGAGWLVLIPAVAALATLAIVVAERDRGTLAWSLTKACTREAFLASKLASGIGMFAVVGIAVPMVPAAAPPTLVYGSVPDPAVVALIFFGTVALSALFVTLTVTISVLAWSQAAAAVAALGMMLGAQVIGSILPEIHDDLPTSIGEWIARLAVGGPGSVATPIAYGITFVGLLLVARRAFTRMDL